MASSEDTSSPKTKRAKREATSVAFSSTTVSGASTEAESYGKSENPTEDVSQNPNNKTGSDSSHAKSYLRVTKYNLYMIIALWMEDFVYKVPESDKGDEETKTPEQIRKESYRNVGAVLVLPNDVVLAADCSRDGVHVVARLLMEHNDKAEGCKMFMSRKPCPFCAKLLVQSKVERVLYLPFEPEYYRSPETESDKKHNETLMKQVNNMFTASSIGQTKFVLQVEKAVLVHANQKTAAKGKSLIIKQKDELKEKYFPKFWLNYHVKDELPWPAFDDELNLQVQKYFLNTMEWIARAKVLAGKGLEYDFRQVFGDSQPSNNEFNPEVPKSPHEQQAQHFITMARFLAERTDDPKTGVGAVIVKYPSMEIIAFGWNGFPLKAQYGEFARASKHDKTANDKKYPYVLHAEQNALLMRNTKNIEGSILFVTKSPCNECAPLLKLKGVKTVVVDDDVDLCDKRDHQPNALDYEMFPNMVKNRQFICYQTVRKRAGGKAKIKLFQGVGVQSSYNLRSKGFIELKK